MKKFNYLKCKWKRVYEEVDEYYETSCGEAFSLTVGTLKDNHWVYCPTCGRKIKEVNMALNTELEI